MKHTAVRTLLTAILATGLLAGCGKGNPWREKADASLATRKAIPLRAIVTDLEDVREAGSFYNSGVTMIPLVGLYGSYANQRFDDLDQSAVESFPKMIARDMAKRLEEGGAFDEVTYAPADAIPPRGEYDVVLRGRIDTLKARGKVTRYGLSLLGDLLWEVGLPKLTRNWQVDIEYWAENAYTGERIGAPVRAQWNTDSAVFTQYHNTRRVPDLLKRIAPVYDQLVVNLGNTLEDGSSAKWVTLKTEGERLLAEERRTADQLRKGTPPTFSFLYPAQGAELRESTATVRWSIAAPNGLRTALMAAGSTTLELGLDPLDMADAEAAPRSVAAREIQVPLAMGVNKLRARVSDHRGNQTDANLEITRLPKALVPARRFALLLAGDAPVARASAGVLQAALVDPAVGQFEPGNVTTVVAETLTGDAIRDSITTFGRAPLSGDLVMVYLGANGDWDTLGIGDGTMTMPDLVEHLRTSLAAEDVIFLCDVDWQGTSDAKLDSRVNVPRRWGMLTPTSMGGPRPVAADTTTLVQLAEGTLRGALDQRSRLSLERFLDVILAGLDNAPGNTARAELFGRPNPSLTMAERE